MKIWLPFIGKIDAKKAILGLLALEGYFTGSTAQVSRNTSSSSGGPQGVVVQFKAGIPPNGTNSCDRQLYCSQYYAQNGSAILARGTSFIENADDFYERYETAGTCFGTTTGILQRLWEKANSSFFGSETCTSNQVITQAAGVDLTTGCSNSYTGGIHSGIVVMNNTIRGLSARGCSEVKAALNTPVRDCMQSKLDDLFANELEDLCDAAPEDNTDKEGYILLIASIAGIVIGVPALGYCLVIWLDKRFGSRNNANVVPTSTTAASARASLELPPVPESKGVAIAPVAERVEVVTPALKM